MKQFKIIFLSLAFLTAGLAFSSCGGDAEATEKQGKEYTSAYVCTMHCENSGSEAAGKCPVCGMDYVKNENHKFEGKEEGGHEGHNH